MLQRLWPRLRLAAQLRRGKAVERRVVGGVHGHQLALQVGRQLRHLEASLGQGALDLVAVGLALRGLLEIEQAAIPTRDLQPLEAERRGPVGDRRQAVERRSVAGELGEKDGRPLDRLHRMSSLTLPSRQSRSGERLCPSSLSFPRNRESRTTAPSLALNPRFRGGDEIKVTHPTEPCRDPVHFVRYETVTAGAPFSVW
jgi:hypothetical protein